MKRVRHLDEQALIGIVVHGSPGAVPQTHVDYCLTCQHEIETWERISAGIKAAVSSVTPPKEDLAERLIRQLERPSGGAPARSTRRSRSDAGRNRGTRWVLAVAGVVAAVVLSTIFALGSSSPSVAMVLATVKRSPSLVAAVSRTVNYTAYEVVRAPQGYTITNFRTDGSFDSRTNTFQYTTTSVFPGQPSASATYVSDGTLVYLPCDVAWRQIGKQPCIAYPAENGGISSTPSLAFLEHARGPVARLGQRMIGSVETTGYTVTVPVNAWLAGVPPSARSLAQYSLATTKVLRVDVWIDSRGLPRELQTTDTQAQSTLTFSKGQVLAGRVQVTVQQRLSYSQTPLHVSVPNKNTVVVVPNLGAAVQLLNTYNQELGTFEQRLLHGT